MMIHRPGVRWQAGPGLAPPRDPSRGAFAIGTIIFARDDLLFANNSRNGRTPTFADGSREPGFGKATKVAFGRAVRLVAIPPIRAGHVCGTMPCCPRRRAMPSSPKSPTRWGIRLR
jgi:hypothetical protein